jgi:iron complex outermembrane receptor protein
MGFSIYANGSLNSAKDKGEDVQNPGQWVANAPKSSAALGVIYNRAQWYASLIDKYVGTRYGDVGQAIPLADSRKIYALAGYTGGAGTPLYWTIPGRSVFATLTVPF